MSAEQLLESAGFVRSSMGWMVPGDPGQPRAYLPHDSALAMQYAKALVRGRRLAADGEERQRLDDWLQRAEA